MAEPQGIQVSRAHAWRDGARSYRVMLDGKHVADVDDGQEVTVPASAGTHELQLRISMTGSPRVSVEVATNEYVRFTCRPPQGPVAVWKTLQALWSRDRYIVLEPQD